MNRFVALASVLALCVFCFTACGKKKADAAKKKSPCAVVVDRLTECTDDAKEKTARSKIRDKHIEACKSRDKATRSAKNCAKHTDCEKLRKCLRGS